MRWLDIQRKLRMMHDGRLHESGDEPPPATPILTWWYSPPVYGDIGLAGARWCRPCDQGWELCTGQAWVVQGALKHEHIRDWPIDVIERVASLLPDVEDV